MKCAREACFSNRATFSTPCHRCADLRDSAIVIGVCFGMCAMIIALARVGRML